MSKVSINKRGLERLASGLGSLVDDVIEDGLAEIRDEAKRRVHVITGKTRDSIRVEGDTVVAEHGALYEEFGTRYRPPHPFLRPAFDMVAPKIADRIGERIRNVVR